MTRFPLSGDLHGLLCIHRNHQRENVREREKRDLGGRMIVVLWSRSANET